MAYKKIPLLDYGIWKGMHVNDFLGPNGFNSIACYSKTNTT